MESPILSLSIDAKEKHDVATADVVALAHFTMEYCKHGWTLHTQSIGTCEVTQVVPCHQDMG